MSQRSFLVSQDGITFLVSAADETHARAAVSRHWGNACVPVDLPAPAEDRVTRLCEDYELDDYLA